MDQLRVFNNGAGVQSTAMLVLAGYARRYFDAIKTKRYKQAAKWRKRLCVLLGKQIDSATIRATLSYPIFLRSNVGDDSEQPQTVDYYEHIHRPFAKKYGIALIDVRRSKKDGTAPTLLEQIYFSPQSVPIPMRGMNGSPLSRTCTGDFKIKPIAKWLKQQGATKDNPAVSGLGISMDEFQRMKNTSGIDWQRLEYPLITLRLNRDDCRRIVAMAGLPPAPRSSCWFCPFHVRKDWQAMRDNEPELFARSVEIETYLSKKSTDRGKPPLFLTGYAIPLDQLVTGNQAEMVLDDNCESGYCHT